MLAGFFALAPLVGVGAAAAQDVRDLALELQAERDAIAGEARIATGLYVVAGILSAGGVVTLLGGSIGTLACGPGVDCSASEIAIAIGGIAAGLGLLFFIPATAVDHGAGRRRRQLMRESLSLRAAPYRSGVMVWLDARF